MENKNPLSGAKVTLENKEKNFKYETIMTELLQIPELPEGVYTITITKEGYEPYIQKCKLGKYEHLRLNVDLTPLPKKQDKEEKPKKTKTKPKTKVKAKSTKKSTKK